MSKHCIPASVLDPQRLIFYGGTAAGQNSDDEGVQFFAYDTRNRKLLYSGPDGPARYMIFARSTGRVYYVPGKDDGPGWGQADPEEKARQDSLLAHREFGRLAARLLKVLEPFPDARRAIREAFRRRRPAPPDPDVTDPST